MCIKSKVPIFLAFEVVFPAAASSRRSSVTSRFRSAFVISVMVSRMPNRVHNVSSWTVTQGIAWPDVKDFAKGKRSSRADKRRAGRPPGAGASGPSNYGVAINLIKPELMYGCPLRLRARRSLYLRPAFAPKFEIQVSACAV